MLGMDQQTIKTIKTHVQGATSKNEENLLITIVGI